jgi:hypothetical protein
MHLLFRLKGDGVLVAALERCREYMQSAPPDVFSADEMCHIYMRLIEHIYYAFEPASCVTITNSQRKIVRTRRLCNFGVQPLPVWERRGECAWRAIVSSFMPPTRRDDCVSALSCARSIITLCTTIGMKHVI